MGDWEDYVTKVCVLGRPAQMQELASQWEQLFHNAGSVAEELRRLSSDLQSTFTGPAGDAYRKHLDTIRQTIEKVHDDHVSIVQSLNQAAGDLDTAQQNMPVPDYMMDDVNNRRAELDQLNMAGARAMTGMLSPGLALAPDAFYKPLANSFIGNWGREMFGHFSAWWDDWNGKMTAQAKQWYDRVDQQNLQTALSMPAAQPAPSGHGYSDTNPNLGGGGSGEGTGHVPGVGSPGMHAGTGGISAGTHGYGGTGSGTAGTGGLPGEHTPYSGLAGAGTGGLSGLGGGSGGLGAGGLGAGGLGSTEGGGLGASGTGAGLAGKAVSPAGMPMAGMGGMPMGAAGRGGAGKGASARGRSGAAGMAGGHGGHGRGDGDERYTWLQEDEDVWGTGTDAPSGTIG